MTLVPRDSIDPNTAQRARKFQLPSGKHPRFIEYPADERTLHGVLDIQTFQPGVWFIDNECGAISYACYTYVCYTYDMAQRTTLILDDETRHAARQLALHYGCSTSEAIRRAVLRHRDAVFGVPAESRKERRKVLDRLVELFSANDAER